VGWDMHNILCDGIDKYVPWTILSVTISLKTFWETFTQIYLQLPRTP